MPASVEAVARRPSTQGAQPLFIFSATRSGSTLLQRILATYEEIATPAVSEPWVLIPQLYALRRDGVAAEYTHTLLVEAIEDFAKQLPGGQEGYLREVRELILRLYANTVDGGPARYVLDKTPSYFFVVEEVMRLFPDAKFIFLWRNPLSIIASLISWDEGKWDPTRYRVVLFDGIARLVAAWRRHGERACAVRYEDLVRGEEHDWLRVMDYLGLEFDPRSLSRFSEVELEGRTGDPFGVKLYSQISHEPLTKWKRIINNPIRKAWCARYLRWLGRERLAVIGYELDALLTDLDQVPMTAENLLGDGARLAQALVKEPVRARARRSVGLSGPSAFRYMFES